jgi:hypothetical protein
MIAYAMMSCRRTNCNAIRKDLSQIAQCDRVVERKICIANFKFEYIYDSSMKDRA